MVRRTMTGPELHGLKLRGLHIDAESLALARGRARAPC